MIRSNLINFVIAVQDCQFVRPHVIIFSDFLGTSGVRASIPLHFIDDMVVNKT